MANYYQKAPTLLNSTLRPYLDRFNNTYRVKNYTIHSRLTLDAPSHIIGMIEASDAPRLASPVTANNSIFLKHSRIGGFKHTLRVTFGRRKKPSHGGSFDWPIEELINTITAGELDNRNVEVMGFGYHRNNLGLVTDFFILTENLADYIDGHAWLVHHESKAHEFINRACETVLELNLKGLLHLDLKPSNFMVRADLSTMKLIDFENCHREPTSHIDATIGLQFGTLFHVETHQFISETEYDKTIFDALDSNEQPIGEPFSAIYEYSKRNRVARKARKRVPQKGSLW